MENNVQFIWDRISTEIKDEMSETGYNNWIKPLRPLKVEDNVFSLETVDAFHKEMIESRHMSVIKNAIAKLLNDEYKIELFSAEDDEYKTAAEDSFQKEFNPELFGNLNNRYTFESFVVGANNRLAHAAAVAVAEKPAGAYNPLFLYGGVGLGKTHLMHAIAFEILGNDDKSKVLYVSSETFTNELINAIKHNKNEEFRQKYRNIDVLLIDDIQFLAEKEQTQEEFFHTFNTLHDANKQIIISSDRSPKEIKTLEDRLSSRFKQGLVADVKAPDYETRIAILRKKAERYRMIIDDDILEYIAKNVSSNIRELEGALTKIDAYAKLVGAKVTLSLIERILKDFFNDNANKIITPELVISVISNHYEVTSEDLRSNKRARPIAKPRQIAMYLCRKLTALSLAQIGDSFGGRDHTTIMHGCTVITTELEKSPELSNTLFELEKKIKGSSL